MSSTGHMPGDGDDLQCRTPRPAQRSGGTSCRRREICQATEAAKGVGRLAPLRGLAGLLVVAGRYTRRRRWRTVRTVSPRSEVWQEFLSSPGNMPGDGDGLQCRPPRPAQRSGGTSCRRRAICQATVTAKGVQGLAPRRSGAGFLGIAKQYARRWRRPTVQAVSPRSEVLQDFLSSPGDIPGDGGGRRCWPPPPSHRSGGTSCCCRAICQGTATAESIGRPPRPAQKPSGDFVLAKSMLGDGSGQRYWPQRPSQ